MSKTRTWTSITLLVLVLSIVRITKAQTALQIPVSTPIHGSFIFNGYLSGVAAGTQLLLVDTYTGQIQSLHQYDSAIDDLSWDTEGKRVAYHNYPVSRTLFDALTGQLNELTIPGDEHTFFNPQGWSSDDTQILYISTQIDLQHPNDSIEKLEIMESDTGTLTTLLSYQEGQILDNIPLPPLPEGVTQLVQREIRQADWNPVYQDWFVVQLVGHTDEVMLADSGQGTDFYPTMLFNRRTEMMISLDQFLGQNIQSSPVRWSPDGKGLFVRTDEGMNIIGFDVSSENPVLTLQNQADSGYINVEDWLGTGDLLFGGITDPSTSDHVYYVGEIINQRWNQVEFFRLPAGDVPLVSSSDWHLSASDEEKQALICLFNQVKPCKDQNG